MDGFTRRGFIGTAAVLAAAPALARAAGGSASPPLNPLVRQRADAQLFRHDDGLYYLTASVPEYDRLIIRRSPTLAGLASGEEAVIWRRPAGGPLGGYIWAPELHEIDGRWHMYFAAGDGGDPFHIRTYVLRCRDADALSGRWEMLGKLETPWDSFTLDSTFFVHRGTRYLCWAQREPGIETNSNLYLAPLAGPTRLARPPARLSVPTLDWEVRGFKVNEAPALLARNGRLFLTYSASATDARYCLGMLTADADADIMDPRVWMKSQEPVFTTSPVTGVYGPGHNSFTVDEEGRDLLVYHGRDYETISGDPLFDPNRHTRIQRIYYRPDGTPDFGIPVGNGPLPDRFSPLGRPDRFLRHEGAALSIGAGPLPASQFRRIPAGAGRVMIAPIDAPELRLTVLPDGMLALAREGAAAFRLLPGLDDARGISLATPDGRHVQAADDGLRVAPVRTTAARASATFLLS